MILHHTGLDNRAGEDSPPARFLRMVKLKYLSSLPYCKYVILEVGTLISRAAWDSMAVTFEEL